MLSLTAISPALQLLLTAALLSDSDVLVTLTSAETSLATSILPVPAQNPAEPVLSVFTVAQGLLLTLPLTDAAATDTIAIGKQGTVALVLSNLPAPYAPL